MRPLDTPGRGSVRTTDLVTEAWRNVRSGASRVWVLVLLVAPAVLGLAWLEMSQVATVERDALAYRASGASTYVLTSSGRVDGAKCEALARVASVRNSGALRATPGSFVPRATPRSPIPVFEVTPGLAEQLTPGYSTGTALDSTTAQMLGTGPGHVLRGQGGDAAILSIYPYADDGRDQTLAYAMVRSAPAFGRYDQCWLSEWPPDQGRASSLLQASLAPGADLSEVRVGQLNARLGSDFHGPEDFASRTSRFAGIAALVVGLVGTIGSARLRRLELAFAKHLGLQRLEMVSLLVFETAIGVAPTLVATSVVIGVYGAAAPFGDVAPFGVRVLALSALGELVGAVVAGSAVRDSRVYAYFKAR